MTKGWTVRVRCFECGDITIPAPRIRVTVSTEGPRYMFVCPYCATGVVRACSPEIVQMLVDVGCKSNRPAEIDESHLPGPITPDEQLDYYIGLNKPDFIDEVCRSPEVQ